MQISCATDGEIGKVKEFYFDDQSWTIRYLIVETGSWLNDGDPHLRSTHKVTGYSIHAMDGKIGEVEDFLVDDASWKLDYMVIDTGHWFPGKKVLVVDTHNWVDGKKFLIETGIIKEIQWENSKVIVNISIDKIKDCPVFDESQFKHSRNASASLVNG